MLLTCIGDRGFSGVEPLLESVVCDGTLCPLRLIVGSLFGQLRSRGDHRRRVPLLHSLDGCFRGRQHLSDSIALGDDCSELCFERSFALLSRHTFGGGALFGVAKRRFGFVQSAFKRSACCGDVRECSRKLRFTACKSVGSVSRFCCPLVTT